MGVGKFDNYLFYLSTAKTAPMRHLVEHIRGFFMEGTFQCNKDQIRYRNMTKDKDAYVDIKVDASKFEDYYCPNPIDISLNMENVFRIMKDIDQNDTLKWYMLKNKPDKFTIHIYNKEENVDEFVSFNTMDLDITEMPKRETAEFEDVVTIPTVRFQKICRSIAIFNKKIEIEKSSLQVEFKGASSREVGQVFIVKPTENGVRFGKKKGAEDIVQGVFILSYLQEFSKCNNLSRTIDVMFTNDYPLILECDIADFGKSTLIIAPQFDESS
jgi:proliferating cell nuclear antigen PCNA